MSKDKKFNPLNSKGFRGIPPHERYPNSQLITALYNYDKKKIPPFVACDHEADCKSMSYKNLAFACNRAFQLVDRLSYLLVEKELQCEKLAKYINNSRKNGGNNDL
jgi:hypothetical protein